MTSSTSNGWTAYEKLVLKELEELRGDLAALDEKVTLLRISDAQMKIKLGLIATACGMLPALITAIIAFNSGGLI